MDRMHSAELHRAVLVGKAASCGAGQATGRSCMPCLRGCSRVQCLRVLLLLAPQIEKPATNGGTDQ